MYDMISGQWICPTCREGRIRELQFKPYIGRYEPCLSQVKVGDKLPYFPAIPVFDELAHASCPRCDAWVTAEVRLKKGVLTCVHIVRGTQDEFAFYPLQPGRNTARKKAAERERQKRVYRSGMSMGCMIGDFIRESIARPSFADRLLRGGRNYRKGSEGKWRRITPY